jgi:hypothetical protein
LVVLLFFFFILFGSDGLGHRGVDAGARC